MQILIAVDTLEFLHRGGRVSRAQKVAGGALGVRPLLTLREGEVVPYGKVYGRRGVWRAFERFLAQHAPPGSAPRVGIAHGHAERDAQRLVELVRRVSPQARVDRVCEIGPVVGTHGGPGTLGLLVLPA
jgi:DegV family protein with EDD domain